MSYFRKACNLRSAKNFNFYQDSISSLSGSYLFLSDDRKAIANVQHPVSTRSGFWISDPVDTTRYHCMSFWFMVAHGYTPIYDVNDPVDPALGIALIVFPQDPYQATYQAVSEKVLVYSAQAGAAMPTMQIDTGIWYYAEFPLATFKSLTKVKVTLLYFAFISLISSDQVT